MEIGTRNTKTNLGTYILVTLFFLLFAIRLSSYAGKDKKKVCMKT